MTRSILPDRPLDPTLLHVLSVVSQEADSAGIKYMLVGATARDLLLTHVFNGPAGRATYDADFAVAVANWGEFERLKTGIASRTGFTSNETSLQRLYYKAKDGSAGQSYPIDLVPFGEIASDHGKIVWPPDMAVVMNVAGYDEVLAAAEDVEVASGLICKVTSLAGLAVIKLMAWSDRGPGDPRDAHDLLQLMSTYASAGNEGRLYDTEFALLEAVDYDLDLAGACLLGKDVARLLKPETRANLVKLIDSRHESLMRGMVGAIRQREDAQERVETPLQQFRSGLLMD